MKKKLFFIFLLFTISTAHSQDTIFKKSGYLIIAKVIEISPSEVKYKLFDFQDGPLHIELKSSIDKIKFSNGVTEIFKEIYPQENTSVVPENQEFILNNNRPNITNNKIERWGKEFHYQNERIYETEMQDLLYKTKNKKIIALTDKARTSRAIQYIGFLGIPLGTLSYIYFIKSTGLLQSSYSNNNQPRNNFGLYDYEIKWSGVFLAGAITCPIVADVFKFKRRRYNDQAIKIYNEKY